MIERQANPGGNRQLELNPFPCWSDSSAGLEIRFVGRTQDLPASDPATVLSALGATPQRIATLEQRHSATVRVARDGLCGEGDGLWTTTTDLALCIVTADCVPIVCGSNDRVAVIHAGWRGLVAGVIEASVQALPGPAGELEAWLGPAIGPCCYEVGDDVATSVSACSSNLVATEGHTRRPHLDLHLAAEVQLRRLGIARLRRVAECTKCHPELLWSYRGNKGKRGRNLTLAWLTPKSEVPSGRC